MTTTHDPVPASARRTAHQRTQVFGLLLVTLTLAVQAIVDALFFEGEFLPVMVVMLAVFGGSMLVVRRYDRTWANVAAIVLVVAVSMLNVYAFFGLFLFLSPIEFGAALLMTAGVVLTIGGGVRAIRARRRGHLGPLPIEDVIVRRGSALIGALIAASIVSFLVTRTTVPDAEALGAVAVGMSDFAFDPVDIEVPSDGRLLLSNEDLFVHDFTVPDLDIAVSLNGANEALLEIDGAAPGTYELVCTLHEFGGMVGTVTITG